MWICEKLGGSPLLGIVRWVLLFLFVVMARCEVGKSKSSESMCPCLPMNKCPRIYGQSAMDMRELGFIEPCQTFGTFRCCGVTIRIQHDKDLPERSKDVLVTKEKIKTSNDANILLLTKDLHTKILESWSSIDPRENDLEPSESSPNITIAAVGPNEAKSWTKSSSLNPVETSSIKLRRRKAKSPNSSSISSNQFINTHTKSIISGGHVTTEGFQVTQSNVSRSNNIAPVSSRRNGFSSTVLGHSVVGSGQELNSTLTVGYGISDASPTRRHFPILKRKLIMKPIIPQLPVSLDSSNGDAIKSNPQIQTFETLNRVANYNETAQKSYVDGENRRLIGQKESGSHISGEKTQMINQNSAGNEDLQNRMKYTYEGEVSAGRSDVISQINGRSRMSGDNIKLPQLGSKISEGNVEITSQEVTGGEISEDMKSLNQERRFSGGRIGQFSQTDNGRRFTGNTIISNNPTSKGSAENVEITIQEATEGDITKEKIKPLSQERRFSSGRARLLTQVDKGRPIAVENITSSRPGIKASGGSIGIDSGINRDGGFFVDNTEPTRVTSTSQVGGGRRTATDTSKSTTVESRISGGRIKITSQYEDGGILSVKLNSSNQQSHSNRRIAGTNDFVASGISSQKTEPTTPGEQPGSRISVTSQTYRSSRIPGDKMKSQSQESRLSGGRIGIPTPGGHNSGEKISVATRDRSPISSGIITIHNKTEVQFEGSNGKIKISNESGGIRQPSFTKTILENPGRQKSFGEKIAFLRKTGSGNKDETNMAISDVRIGSHVTSGKVLTAGSDVRTGNENSGITNRIRRPFAKVSVKVDAPGESFNDQPTVTSTGKLGTQQSTDPVLDVGINVEAVPVRKTVAKNFWKSQRARNSSRVSPPSTQNFSSTTSAPRIIGNRIRPLINNPRKLFNTSYNRPSVSDDVEVNTKKTEYTKVVDSSTGFQTSFGGKFRRVEGLLRRPQPFITSTESNVATQPNPFYEDTITVRPTIEEIISSTSISIGKIRKKIRVKSQKIFTTPQPSTTLMYTKESGGHVLDESFDLSMSTPYQNPPTSSSFQNLNVFPTEKDSQGHMTSMDPDIAITEQKEEDSLDSAVYHNHFDSTPHPPILFSSPTPKLSSSYNINEPEVKVSFYPESRILPVFENDSMEPTTIKNLWTYESEYSHPHPTSEPILIQPKLESQIGDNVKMPQARPRYSSVSYNENDSYSQSIPAKTENSKLRSHISTVSSYQRQAIAQQNSKRTRIRIQQNKTVSESLPESTTVQSRRRFKIPFLKTSTAATLEQKIEKLYESSEPTIRAEASYDVIMDKKSREHLEVDEGKEDLFPLHISVSPGYHPLELTYTGPTTEQVRHIDDDDDRKELKEETRLHVEVAEKTQSTPIVPSYVNKSEKPKYGRIPFREMTGPRDYISSLKVNRPYDRRLPSTVIPTKPIGKSRWSTSTENPPTSTEEFDITITKVKPQNTGMSSTKFNFPPFSTRARGKLIPSSSTSTERISSSFEPYVQKPKFNPSLIRFTTTPSKPTYVSQGKVVTSSTTESFLHQQILGTEIPIRSTPSHLTSPIPSSNLDIDAITSHRGRVTNPFNPKSYQLSPQIKSTTKPSSSPRFTISDVFKTSTSNSLEFTTNTPQRLKVIDQVKQESGINEKPGNFRFKLYNQEIGQEEAISRKPNFQNQFESESGFSNLRLDEPKTHFHSTSFSPFVDYETPSGIVNINIDNWEPPQPTETKLYDNSVLNNQRGNSQFEISHEQTSTTMRPILFTTTSSPYFTIPRDAEGNGLIINNYGIQSSEKQILPVQNQQRFKIPQESGLTSDIDSKRPTELNIPKNNPPPPSYVGYTSPMSHRIPNPEFGIRDHRPYPEIVSTDFTSSEVHRGPPVQYSPNQFTPYTRSGGSPIQFPREQVSDYIKEYHHHHAISKQILSKLENPLYRTSRSANLTESELEALIAISQRIGLVPDQKIDEKKYDPQTLKREFQEEKNISAKIPRLEPNSTSLNNRKNTTYGHSNKSSENLFNSAMSLEDSQDSKNLHTEIVSSDENRKFRAPITIQRGGFMPLVPYSEKDPGPLLMTLSGEIGSRRTPRGLKFLKDGELGNDFLLLSRTI